MEEKGNKFGCIWVCINIAVFVVACYNMVNEKYSYVFLFLFLFIVSMVQFYRWYNATENKKKENAPNKVKNISKKLLADVSVEVEDTCSYQNKSKINDVSTISTFDYDSIVMFKAIQLLESIYIVETTKNLDTLSGRIDFINGMYGYFIPASKMKSYQGHMASVIDEYKAMYYDRMLTENQVNLLLYPNIENIHLFYSDCIVSCYIRYVEQQTIEMNKLKTEAGKERRREDMIKKGYSAKYMFKTYELPDAGHLDAIENIREQFYSYKKLK